MKDGEFVNIDYVGKIKESGEIFDLTDEKLAKESKIYNPQVKYGPITIVLGAGQIIKGLEDEIKSMKEGEKKSLELPPEKGFGDRDARLVKTFAESKFKKNGITPVQGRFIDFGGTKGRVMSVAGGRVRVDFNHPLAGKTLSYDVKLNKMVADEKEQILSLVTYYTMLDKDVKITIESKNAKIQMPKASEIKAETKSKIAEMITKHVVSVENVEFSEVFAKKEE